MFLILNSLSLIVDISPYAHYVKAQDNSINVECEKENADAIYSANSDEFYPLKGIKYLSDSYVLTEVNEIPPDVIAGYYYYHNGEFYTTYLKQAELTQANFINDLPEILVDQEFRLTLLELGVL